MRPGIAPLDPLYRAILLVAARMAEYSDTADEAACALVEDGIVSATIADQARVMIYAALPLTHSVKPDA